MSDNTKGNSDGRGGWKRFWFILHVVEIRLRFVFILIITGMLVGYWDVVKNYYDKYTRPLPAVQTAMSDIEFFCPMHTFIVRPEYGKCPICGMDLVKHKKGEKQELPEGAVSRVQVSPMQIAEGHVKVESVGYMMLSRDVRAVGAVESNEKSQAIIAARFPGRVGKLLVNYVGAHVQKNDPVAQIYSPKYLAAMQEYLQSATLSGPEGRSSDLTNAAKERLLLAGFTEAQLAEAIKRGKADPYMTYYSPIEGTVVDKSVVEGQYVDEGAPLLSVIDLKSVWIQLRVLESDMAFVKVGQPVEIRSVAYPGVMFVGNVNFVFPTVETDTRSVKVRVEVNNAQMRLKPGMYVTAVMHLPQGGFEPLEQPDLGPLAAKLSPSTSGTLISSSAADAKPGEEWEEGYTCVMHPEHLQETSGPCNLCDCGMQMTLWRREKFLAVLELSVIDTGLRKFVYVEDSPGVFDAHQVVLGAKAGEYYPVLSGLQDGERIATDGSFLIDAENRLNPSSDINKPPAEAPMELNPTSEESPATVVIKGGFAPETIALSPGSPRQITFDRREEGECSSKIIFPTLGIEKELPAFQKTTVDLPTTATGMVPYSCGKDMLHGKVILPPAE